jgi:hypothetical protein
MVLEVRILSQNQRIDEHLERLLSSLSLQLHTVLGLFAYFYCTMVSKASAAALPEVELVELVVQLIQLLHNTMTR